MTLFVFFCDYYRRQPPSQICIYVVVYKMREDKKIGKEREANDGWDTQSMVYEQICVLRVTLPSGGRQPGSFASGQFLSSSIALLKLSSGELSSTDHSHPLLPGGLDSAFLEARLHTDKFLDIHHSLGTWATCYSCSKQELFFPSSTPSAL